PRARPVCRSPLPEGLAHSPCRAGTETRYEVSPKLEIPTKDQRVPILVGKVVHHGGDVTLGGDFLGHETIHGVLLCSSGQRSYLESSSQSPNSGKGTQLSSTGTSRYSKVSFRFSSLSMMMRRVYPLGVWWSSSILLAWSSLSFGFSFG